MLVKPLLKHQKTRELFIKFIFVVFISLSPLFALSQDHHNEQTIEKLIKAIQNSEKAERLILMDSLTTYTKEGNKINHDSLMRVTISLAKELDSFDIAVQQAAHLIGYINYRTPKRENALNLITNTKPLLKHVKDKSILGHYYLEVADLYYYTGELDNSIKNYDSALHYAKTYKTNYIGVSALGKGIVYVNKGAFGEASIALQEAIRYFQKHKDTTKWIDAKNSMIILYGKSGFYEEEEKERNEVIDLALQLESYPNLPVIYYNAAASANKMGKQRNRIANLKLAIQHNEVSDYKAFFEPILKYGLAVAYADNDSIPLAENIIKTLETDLDKNTTGFNKTFYLEAKKRLAFAQKTYDEAIKYGEAYLSIKKEGHHYEEIQEAEKFLSEVYMAMSDSSKAIEHFKNYTHIKDSIGAIQKTRVLAYYQTLYETEKRDLTIKAQESNIALLDSENKRKTQWLLLGGISLVGIFGFVSILRSRNHAKNKQQLQETFTHDMITHQEEERTRVAMELHDGIGQQLMLLTRKSKTSGDDAMETLAKDTLQSVRNISQGLYPVVLERIGFTAGVLDLVDTIDSNTSIVFTVDLDTIDEYITKQQALHLYRIIQELLNNCVTHAQATSVTLDIKKTANSIHMTLEDNGKGFAYDHTLKTSKSLGMKSIRERSNMLKANLHFKSIPNKGVTVIIQIPIDKNLT